MDKRPSDFEDSFDDALNRIMQDGQIEDIHAPDETTSEELRRQLEAAQWLNSAGKRLDARPGFVDASRKRLISQIKEEPNPSNLASGGWLTWVKNLLQAPRQLSRAWAVLAAAVVLACALLSGGAAATSAAMPGDLLYSTKISFESIQLSLVSSTSANASLHIRFAHARLEEIDTLIRTSRFTHLSQAIDNYQQHVEGAMVAIQSIASHNPAQSKSLAYNLIAMISDHQNTLAELSANLPPNSRQEVDHLLMISNDALSAASQIIIADDEQLASTPGNPPPPTSIFPSVDVVKTSPAPTSTVISPTLTVQPAASSATISVTPLITDTATSTLAPGSRTPTPIVAEQDTEPSEEVKPTKKPTKTKKPLPDPTRRPPKPDQ